MDTIIKGKKINLRLLRSSDAESIWRHARNPVLGRFAAVPYPFTLQRANDYIRRARAAWRKQSMFVFGIEIPADGKVVGMISVFDVSRRHKNAEIGYWLGKNHWSGGIMTEAVRLTLDYCFRRLRLMRVVAPVFTTNVGSVKVLEKRGFVHEGIMRKRRYHRRQWFDVHIYAKNTGSRIADL
jgi:ribosomal-protein-alanine N-acetyltransferase